MAWALSPEFCVRRKKMKDTPPTPEETEQRKRWFESYINCLEMHSIDLPRKEGLMYRCPCCGSRTLEERGGYDICPVCFWEDDGQDGNDADTVRGGPNGRLSLTQARKNYQDIGASSKDRLKHVRRPTEEEI